MDFIYLNIFVYPIILVLVEICLNKSVQRNQKTGEGLRSVIVGHLIDSGIRWRNVNVNYKCYSIHKNINAYIYLLVISSSPSPPSLAKCTRRSVMYMREYFFYLSKPDLMLEMCKFSLFMLHSKCVLAFLYYPAVLTTG